MIYRPTYDTTISTVTTTTKQNTLHTYEIDWENYPFDSLEHVHVMCCGIEEKVKHLEQLKEWLRLCERCKECEILASNYGGWPRIWNKVLRVGMGSFWPFWQPRPVIIVMETLDVDWYDWTALTGARYK